MEDAGTLTLIIVANDPLVRTGLATVLEPFDLFVIDAVSPDVFGKTDEADVLLWDADPDLDTELIKQQSVPVLALVSEGVNAQPLIAVGCMGILFRSASSASIVAALNALAEGLQVIEPSLLTGLLTAPEEPDEILTELTPRELDVLELVSEGLSNKAIAKRLDISVNTVKFHVNALLSKFGVRGRTELVVRALQQGSVHF